MYVNLETWHVTDRVWRTGRKRNIPKKRAVRFEKPTSGSIDANVVHAVRVWPKPAYLIAIEIEHVHRTGARAEREELAMDPKAARTVGRENRLHRAA